MSKPSEPSSHPTLLYHTVSIAERLLNFILKIYLKLENDDDYDYNDDDDEEDRQREKESERERKKKKPQ